MAKSQKKIFNEIKAELLQKHHNLENISDIDFKNAMRWVTSMTREKINEYYHWYLSYGVISEIDLNDGKGGVRVVFNE